MALALCGSIAAVASGQDKSDSTVSQDATRIFDRYPPLSGKSGAHPDFILPSIDGDSQIQLSSYRGKKVLLLHFASW